jgi:zinc/manganese transport system ATP-binding protein
MDDNMTIELDDVTTFYEGANKPTIKNINLKIAEGEFVAIIGPNAVGKTTLLETINGLLKIKMGKVKVFGKDVSKNGPEVRRDIGYLFQGISFDEEAPFLVKDVVAMGMYGKIGVLKSPTKGDKKMVSGALSQIGISHLAERPIGKLSGGELQRVMLARELVKKPRIMMLDEPFNNLDINAREELVSIISKVHNDMNLTMLIIVHELDYIHKFDNCKRVVLIAKGDIAKDSKPKDILKAQTIKKFFGGV